MAIRKEVEVKIGNKAEVLKQEVARLKEQYNLAVNDMIKNLKKVSAQSQAEKAGIQEQFDFIYSKYAEKKQQCKDLSKQLDKNKKHLENQRKIYERLFTEGFKIEDVRKIMERYMEKEAAKSTSSMAKTAQNIVGLHSFGGNAT